jgi:ABC-type dipeptide/oligopeptide/nickel transport system permease component
MLQYIIRRLLWLPLLLLIISFITFVLGVYGPGDPVVTRLGPRARPEAVARLRAQLGLDRPLAVQYVEYVGKAVRLDFGESPRYQNQEVRKLIGDRIWVTVQVSALALAFSLLVGIPLGIVAALTAGRWPDRLGLTTVLLFNSVPSFVAIPLLLAVLVRGLHLLPPPGWDGILSTRIILPVFVLGMGPVAGLARQTRASMLEVLPQDYIRTARAKGLRENAVILRHALKNAMIPLLTIIAFMVGALPEGAFITENLLGVPGIGQLGFDSLFARDYPVIMALTLIGAVAFVLANLLADVAYAVLDPRIRYR